MRRQRHKNRRTRLCLIQHELVFDQSRSFERCGVTNAQAAPAHQLCQCADADAALLRSPGALGVLAQAIGGVDDALVFFRRKVIRRNMLGDNPAHGGRWVLAEPALAHAEPEEADDAFELLFAGKFLFPPSLPPFGQVARIEFVQEGQAGLFGKAKQLDFEDVAQFLQRGGSQPARLGIAEEDLDGLFDGGHLGGLDLFALNRCVFVFAGEEFRLLPGFGLRRDTEPALATGKGSVEPLGATATTIGGIVFLRAIGMVARIDGKHDASYSSTKNRLVQFRHSLRNCLIFHSLNRLI